MMLSINNILTKIEEGIEGCRKLNYYDFYLDLPSRSKSVENEWIQYVSQYPDSLLHFSRKPVPSPDGHFYTDPSRSVMEYLIDIGFISNFSDACTNIPWRFFSEYSEKIEPYDIRVKAIIKYCALNGVSRRKIHNKFSNWNKRGAPDILDFSGPIKCVEVKFLGDTFSRQQLNVHKKINEISIETSVFTMSEVGAVEKYKRRIAKANKNKFSMLQNIISCSFGEKLNLFFRHNLGNNKKSPSREWSIISRSAGAEHITNYYQGKSLPSSMVGLLSLCIMHSKPNCDIRFTSDEIIRISGAVYNAGYLKWWQVPLLLLPWIENKQADRSLQKIYKLCFEWESLIKTSHYFKDRFQVYLSNDLQGEIPRLRHSEISFNLSDILELHQYIISNNEQKLYIENESHLDTRVFDFYCRFMKTTEIVLRDRNSY